MPRTLVERYGTKGVSVADNIMDMSNFETVLPQLAENPVAEMYCEVKANLTKEQVQLLFPAGIKAVQPGIESLSDRSLRLMQKGVTKFQNIQIMKWCAETRVQVVWNYMYGFPDESDEELSQITEEAEALHHLAPPRGASSLRLDRFSPHFEEAERFGLTPVSVSEPYRHVYPFPDDSLMRLSFFFDCDYFIAKSKRPSPTPAPRERSSDRDCPSSWCLPSLPAASSRRPTVRRATT